LPLCADVKEFAELCAAWDDDVIHFDAGAQAHQEWLDWSTPQPRDGATLDMGQVVLALREALPADTIVCNGAGNFSAWFHRYWRYAGCPSQLAPTNGSMGYGLPAAVAAAIRQPERSVLAVAGDGDFLMNGQELATAVSRQANLLILVVDNGSYGTIRMHQEREYPGRVSGTGLVNPDFAALARAYGAWGGTVERTEEFGDVLKEALGQSGVRLIHLKTDVEQISPALTISALRSRI
jgi:acetolactate synthase-1/2/3 large subunit